MHWPAADRPHPTRARGAGRAACTPAAASARRPDADAVLGAVRPWPAAPDGDARPVRGAHARRDELGPLTTPAPNQPPDPDKGSLPPWGNPNAPDSAILTWYQNQQADWKAKQAPAAPPVSGTAATAPVDAAAAGAAATAPVDAAAAGTAATEPQMPAAR